MSLNEQIIECVMEYSGGDYAQRSALGMARTWVDKGKFERPEKHGEGSWRTRDDLVERLITIFEASGAESEACVAALNAAREKVNAPYQQQSLVMGTAKQKPKDEKKK